MPMYDVQCNQCLYEDTLSLAMSVVSAWDQSAQCPQCKADNSSFRRIMKQAPAAGGKKPGKAPLQSAERDDMRHKEYQRRNPDQVAAAVENVRTGKFEGF